MLSTIVIGLISAFICLKFAITGKTPDIDNNIGERACALLCGELLLEFMTFVLYSVLCH